jgi:hypothetical protein
MPDTVRRTLLMTLAGGAAGCGMHLPRAGLAPNGGGRWVDWEHFPSTFVAPRKVRVWLPPEYDASHENFAVLYMQDGQNLFDPPSPMARRWDVDRHRWRCASPARFDPPSWSRYGMPRTTGRANTGPRRRSRPARRVVAPGAAAGRSADTEPLADGYVRFLATELKLFHRRHYRTRAGRDDTFVMGSSMGAVSLYALCSFPRVGAAGACHALGHHHPLRGLPAHFAPGAGRDPRVERMAAAYRDWLRGHLPPAGRHRLYFDHGTQGLHGLYGPHQQLVDDLLAAKGYRPGVDWMTRVFPGAPHDESAWRERLAIPLTFLLRP